MQITYKLHDSQFRIFNDESRFVVLAAGRRFGKTVLAITKLIMKALEVKKATVWYVAPTYRQAEMIAWKMLFEMIPQKLILKKNEVKLEITLINGSQIALKGADNEDSLRGVGLDYVIMDEYATMKPNVWQEIVRPMLSDRRGGALFIGTPKGKNHFWEVFIKGERKEDGFSSYRMKTVDNPFIPRSEVKEAETQLNERYFRQEYEASFEDFTGLIWPEFNHKDHVTEFQVAENFEKIGALDPAISGTTGVLWGYINEDGDLLISHEFYQKDKRVSEVSESIKDKVPFFFADPAGRRKDHERDGQSYSFFDEYRDQGITLVAAQNDVDAGINRVAEFFKLKKIKIHPRCRNLIEELERYHWSEERETILGIQVPKPYKAKDHLCDCLRYLVMSRFEATPKPEKKMKKNTAAYFEEMQSLNQIEAA